MTKTKDNDFFKMKSDQGKTDWSLLPWRAIESAARIMTTAIAPKEQGGKGYGLASWQDVPEGYFRYEAALIRHFIKRFVYGEIIDPESGEPHMGHIICNAAFVFEKDRQWKEDGKYDANFYERKEQEREAQLPHDRDFQTTYEDNIRQTELVFDYAKPNTKEIYCTKCGVKLIDYIEDNITLKQKQCFHSWDISNI